VLNKVIDSRQSAFLEERGLMDNVLVANEVLEKVKRKKAGCIFFKVDYEKAYDSVCWDFLYYMMDRLGFCKKWISWIRSCLESATVFVLVNGSPTKKFSLKKGLRQGDPLAPFLFLIAVEGLVGVSWKVAEKSLITEIKVRYKKDKVNMLQYVDCTFFFCDASIKSVYNLRVLLNYFELASEMKVNFSKRRIERVGIAQNVILPFVSILNCEVMKTLFKYLGMPVGGC